MSCRVDDPICAFAGDRGLLHEEMLVHPLEEIGAGFDSDGMVHPDRFPGRI
jgi:hypothetical protein